MRPYRIGTRSCTRLSACLSRISTGSRPLAGVQSAWLARGVSRRAALPRAARSPTVRWGTARAPAGGGAEVRDGLMACSFDRDRARRAPSSGPSARPFRAELITKPWGHRRRADGPGAITARRPLSAHPPHRVNPRNEPHVVRVSTRGPLGSERAARAPRESPFSAEDWGAKSTAERPHLPSSGPWATRHLARARLPWLGGSEQEATCIGGHGPCRERQHGRRAGKSMSGGQPPPFRQPAAFQSPHVADAAQVPNGRGFGRAGAQRWGLGPTFIGRRRPPSPASAWEVADVHRYLRRGIGVEWMGHLRRHRDVHDRRHRHHPGHHGPGEG